jgi:enoyl-CoA hydratase/carnithine racemase
MKVLFDVDGDIGRMTLSGPTGNALERPDFADADALREFFAEKRLRAVIVCGEGRSFCSGASREGLGALKVDTEAGARAMETGRTILGMLRDAPVPMVAMIRGAALGGGLEIALACHFRVASENALLGFPESSLGIMPGLGGGVLAEEVVGRGVAMDLVLSGRTLSGEEGLALGLVDEVAPTPELEEATERFLRALIGDKPPHLVRAIVEAVNNAGRLPRDEALRREGELFLEVARKVGDHVYGLAALEEE